MGLCRNLTHMAFTVVVFFKMVLCQVTGENIGKKGRKIKLSIKKIT